MRTKTPKKSPMDEAIQQAELHALMLESREQIEEDATKCLDFDWVVNYTQRLTHHLHGY